MNAVTQAEPVSAATLEHVLGTGDLSKLSTPQRVEYYRRTCETIGVNPLTMPFRFLSLNGRTLLYATKDLTDQLRGLRKIKISIVDKTIDNDLFIVTARATMPDGRQDEDVGAVTIGKLQGDARANAVMKAMTKAKRRVTLSICGMGFTDESELETIPGARTFDPDEEPPAPIRAAAANMSREAKVEKMATVYDTPTAESPTPTRTDAQWKTWLGRLREATTACTSRADAVEIADRPSITQALASAPRWVQDEIRAMLSEAYGRFPEPEGDLIEELAGAEDSWPGPAPA